MNCISGPGESLRLRSRLRDHYWAVLLLLAAVAACGVEISESADEPDNREYSAHYQFRLDPADASATVTLQVRQTRHLLRELSFSVRPGQIDDFEADGDVRIEGTTVRWRVPAEGGTFSWRVRVNHSRGEGTYDAWLGPDWGIFRAEDLIPRARTRVLKGATSLTTFSFELPAGWSAISEYSALQDPVPVERPDRRFDQPTGWMLVGDIGVRRDTIAGIRVAIAAPAGHAVRRLDTLAFLSWMLPEVSELLPQPPSRLTIISAGDPMWRGGLSAPASMFIHAGRPMISENGTSPLMHEVLHIALPLRAGPNSDWIVEGFAEYYGIELLRRGRAITARRHRSALEKQAEWALSAGYLCGETSSGATTALAVTTLAALNEEIVDKTAGAKDLDDVLRQLTENDSVVDLERLADAASTIIGDSSDVLPSESLLGCPKLSANKTNS